MSYQRSYSMMMSAPSNKETKEIFPTINYIWVGPRSTGAGNIEGQDINAAIKMATSNKDNPIVFWCLKQYESEYKKAFSEHKNVQVLSIETQLELELLKDSPASAKKTKEILESSLKDGTRRGKVTAKNVFSLFVLENNGGYVLDTNIAPLKDSEMMLPNYDRFHVPMIKTDEMDEGDKQVNGLLECWMMFSPSPHDPVAKQIQNNHFNNWYKSVRNPDKKSEAYYASFGQAIVSAIHDAYDDASKHKQQPGYWEASYAGGNAFVVESLSLEKTYNNTHKFENRDLYDKTKESESYNTGSVMRARK